MMKQAIQALFGIAMLLMMGLPVLAQIPQDGLLLNADVNLNVRSGAGASFEVIGVIHPGEIYTVLAKQAGWYQIDFLGRAGFVVANLVTVSGVIRRQTEAEISSAVDFTTNTRLNMRMGPGTWTPVMTVIPLGATVTVTARTADNTWLQIIYKGNTGWVKAYYGIISGNVWFLPILEA